MSTVVTDADGLIKLGKAGLLGALLRAAEVLVPEAVYEEAVVRGKREMYEDAFELEKVLRDGGAKIVGADEDEWAEKVLAGRFSLGPGERAALRMARSEGADAVLTDDRAFLSLLGEVGTRALVPAVTVVLLAERGFVEVDEAQEALRRIEGLIRRDVYEAAMEDLIEIGEEKR